MTKEVAEKIVRGITDKIECNTVDIDDWAEFWGFTREEYEEFLDVGVKALESQPCEDCISREDALRHRRLIHDDDGIGYSVVRVDEIIALPSVTPKTGWIPVSERLPRDSGYYLTTTMYDKVYCDYWEGERFNRTEAVIAWMPLPEPYKAESEE